MAIDPRIKEIRIEGHRATRKISCPYCTSIQNVTLVGHLKRKHPGEWEAWSKEFLRLYNETNDPKRVMRAFTTGNGELILSWTAIDNEIRKRIALTETLPKFNPKPRISHWEPKPEEYERFRTTVWDIPWRGTWGVHQPTYRGNWPPQVPRALIEMYTSPGDLVADPFVGGGTTLIEAWTAGRHAIGYDVSDMAISMTEARLAELEQKAGRESLFGLPNVNIQVRKGDARSLEGINSGSIDFICTHPPYGDALAYTYNEPSDLSLISDPREFLKELERVGQRFIEVLKPGGFCAILVGDLRREHQLHPFGFETCARFQGLGFQVEDIIVKTQNRDRSTEFYYKKTTAPTMRLRIAHEYLFVFRKPVSYRSARNV